MYILKKLYIYNFFMSTLKEESNAEETFARRQIREKY